MLNDEVTSAFDIQNSLFDINISLFLNLIRFGGVKPALPHGNFYISYRCRKDKGHFCQFYFQPLLG